MTKQSKLITGPTFEEMLHPDKIDPQVRKRALEMRTKDPLDPINLYNITWRSPRAKSTAYVAAQGADAAWKRRSSCCTRRVFPPAATKWARPIRC